MRVTETKTAFPSFSQISKYKSIIFTCAKTCPEGGDYQCGMSIIVLTVITLVLYLVWITVVIIDCVALQVCQQFLAAQESSDRPDLYTVWALKVKASKAGLAWSSNQKSSRVSTEALVSPQNWESCRLNMRLAIVFLACGLAMHCACAARDGKYYKILGISEDADEQTIKKAYRKGAM